MEALCDWFLSTLANGDADSLISVYDRHKARDDNFDLAEILAFLPSKQHPRLATLIRQTLSSSITDLQRPETEKPEDGDNDEQTASKTKSAAAIRAAAEIIWLHVEKRSNAPCAEMRAVIFDLHAVLLALGQENSHTQNQVAKICEWLWQADDEERQQIVPQTALYLLLRSFKGESHSSILEGKRSLNGGSAADVARVYAMRQALDHLELSENVPESVTIRTLLLRCATSALYLRVEQGRKFLAHLLTLEEIREAIFDALLNQLASVRKQRASLFGTVFLMAWKLEKSEWFFNIFMNIAERAIYAGSEPLATNLRTVLSSFHLSKRVTGVDALLNRVYAPILYKNLMVANPLVRKNAVSILADAFPIHDPGARLEDIEKTIAFQCNKLLDLLDDPAPMVRKVTVEGTARILGLLWELVPPASTRKMIDLMTSKLAFDAASAQVRMAVFDGLEFISSNHLAHQILAVALKRLKVLIHDNVEKVRLSLLNLLLTLKSMRIRTLRYFDVVPLDDLLRRLPIESPAAATKIMELVVPSYFPLEKKGKNAEEIASSQVRACLSMIHSNKDACLYFYRNLNLHIPPGPLCEFAMGISALALEAPAKAQIDRKSGRQSRKKQHNNVQRVRRKSRRHISDENQDPNDESTEGNEKSNRQGPMQGSTTDRVTLLCLVGDILASISPSLAKGANQQLRNYVDEIFGGSALEPLLVEDGNTPEARAACWRIASCISFSHVQSLNTLWREQLLTTPQKRWDSDTKKGEYEALLSSLLTCGIRWGKVSQVQAVVSTWVDAAARGHRASSVGTKLVKKGKRRSNSKRRESDMERSDHAARTNALFALRSCAKVLLENEELRNAFQHALLEAPLQDIQPDDALLHPVGLVRSIRIGCLGALDFALENDAADSGTGDVPTCHLLLDALTASWKLILSSLSEAPTSSPLLEEVNNLIQWSIGAELLENANNMDPRMGLGIINITLSFCADCAALGVLHGESLSSLETIYKNILGSINLSNHSVLVRPVVELLRICFQLFENYCLIKNTSDDDGNIGKGQAILASSKSTLSAICQILRTSKIPDDVEADDLCRLKTVESFFSELVLSISSSSEANVFEDTLGEPLRQCFENFEEAEHNLMATTIRNVFKGIITGASRKALMARRIFETLLSFFFASGEYPTASRATVNFISVLLNSVHSIYDGGENTPEASVRELFAVIEVTVTERFLNESDFQERVEEIQNTLNSLKKICQTETGDEIEGIIGSERATATKAAEVEETETDQRAVQPSSS